MKKLYSFFMLLFLFVSNGIQAQGNSYNMVIEMANGTKFSIGPNDVKSVTFNDGQLVVTGEDLQSILTNLFAKVEANDTKISTLQIETYAWQTYIESLGASMEAMRANMVNANNQITTLEDNTILNSANINAMMGFIEQLNSRVAALEQGNTEPEQPSATITVTTYDASNVAETSATLNGSVSASNTTKSYTVGFFLATSGTPSSSNYTKKVESGSNKTGSYSSSVSGLSDNTTYCFRAFVLYNGEYYYGDTKTFTTKKATTGVLNGHEWVDLGLPSGTKWATCNVGASSEINYGYYYAWGETSTKTTYNEDTYDYYGSYSIPSDISETSYDVAHIQWGSTWRMPTFTEIKELVNKCTFVWTTISGIKGAKFIGPNGNYIFLPAGGGIGKGFGNANVVNGWGEYGRYWSSQISYRENGNFAKSLFFNSNEVKLTTTVVGTTMDMRTQCFNGILVRPVTR